jgi:hypothetical protein
VQLFRLVKITLAGWRQWHSEGKHTPPEHQYDVYMLAALHHLALRHRKDEPVLLKRDRYERFGRRMRRSTTLLAIGASLSK